MRRPLRTLLAACLLACGAAPLAAIEYHAQGDVLPEPPAAAEADPLAELEPSATWCGEGPMQPGMIDGFCDCCCDCCDWCGFDCIYRPRAWIVRADALWLERSQPQNDGIVTGDNGAVLFNAVHLGPDESSGYDLSIMEVDPHGEGTEFRYLQLGEFSRVADLDLTNPIIITTPPTDQITGANDVDVKLESVLRSFELHKMWSPYGTFTFGVRYLELDEDLTIDTVQLVANPLATRTNFRTQNDAVGLQIGYGAMVFEHNCWRLQWQGKAGVYYCEVDSQVRFDSNVAVNNIGFESAESSAVGSEMKLTLLYQFAPGWAFRTGVEAVYLDGFGLATEQVETTENVISNDPIDTDINLGTVYWYGAFIGLEYNF